MADPKLLIKATRAALKAAEDARVARAAAQRKLEVAKTGFYSHAAEAAEGLAPNITEYNKIRELLLRAGTKPDEIKWSGFDEAFKDRYGPTTPGEVAEHFRANVPKIEEVVRGGKPNFDVFVGEPRDWVPNTTWRSAKFDRPSLRLPGGENYRESLMQLHPRRPKEVMEFGEYHEPRPVPVPHPTWRDDETLQRLVDAFAPNKDFTDSHWAEPNVIAHRRLADRTLPGGRRQMQVEESQSDWGQKGRDQGFFRPRDTTERTRLLAERNEARDAQRAYIEELNATDARPAGWPRVGEAEEVEYFRQRRDRLRADPRLQELALATDAANHRLRAYHDTLSTKISNIPEAPYVTNTQKWTDLLTKKTLIDAARGNYDQVTWTPGTEQAERYNLAKHFDSMFYDPERRRFGAMKDRQILHREEDISPERVEELIGKPLASRLFAKEINNVSGAHHLDGVDLTLGDEAMRGYYEGIFGPSLEKHARTHNPNARLTPTEIPGTRIPGGDVQSLGVDLSPEMRESINSKGFRWYERGGEVVDDPDQTTRGFLSGAGRRRSATKSLKRLGQQAFDFLSPMISRSGPNQQRVVDAVREVGNTFGVDQAKKLKWAQDLGADLSYYQTPALVNAADPSGGRQMTVIKPGTFQDFAAKLSDSHLQEIPYEGAGRLYVDTPKRSLDDVLTNYAHTATDPSEGGWKQVPYLKVLYNQTKPTGFFSPAGLAPDRPFIYKHEGRHRDMTIAAKMPGAGGSLINILPGVAGRIAINPSAPLKSSLPTGDRFREFLELHDNRMVPEETWYSDIIRRGITKDDDLPRLPELRAEGGSVGPLEMSGGGEAVKKAAQIIRSGKLSDVMDWLKKTQHPMQAKRFEQAADLTNLESFSGSALRETFADVDSGLYMPMRPSQFEDFASRISDATISAVPYNRWSNVDPKKWPKGGRDERHYPAYLDYLNGIMGTRGASDIPTLWLDSDRLARRRIGDSHSGPSRPYSRGPAPPDLWQVDAHEGRHRMRALTEAGDIPSLVRLQPLNEPWLHLPHVEARVERMLRNYFPHGRDTPYTPEPDVDDFRPVTKFPRPPFADGGVVHADKGGFLRTLMRFAEGKPRTTAIPGHGTVPALPIEQFEDVAQRFATRHGNEYPITKYPEFDEDKARRIAVAYEEMAHNPTSLPVRRAYDALIQETMDQYRALKDTGAEFSFLKPGEANPYAKSPALGYQDLLNNGRLRVFPTSQGYGTLIDISSSPLLRNVGRVGDLENATANDAFRVVHDALGHFGPGNPFFRGKGEERAWKAHSRSYSPDALPAVTSELRGQNSWLNFGPHAGANRAASGADTIYADQKSGLLPPWAWEDKAEGGSVEDQHHPIWQRGFAGGGRFTMDPESRRERRLQRISESGLRIQGIEDEARGDLAGYYRDLATQVPHGLASIASIAGIPGSLLEATTDRAYLPTMDDISGGLEHVFGKPRTHAGRSGHAVGETLQALLGAGALSYVPKGVLGKTVSFLGNSANIGFPLAAGAPDAPEYAAPDQTTRGFLSGAGRSRSRGAPQQYEDGTYDTADRYRYAEGGVVAMDKGGEVAVSPETARDMVLTGKAAAFSEGGSVMNDSDGGGWFSRGFDHGGDVAPRAYHDDSGKFIYEGRPVEPNALYEGPHAFGERWRVDDMLVPSGEIAPPQMTPRLTYRGGRQPSDYQTGRDLLGGGRDNIPFRLRWGFAHGGASGGLPIGLPGYAPEFGDTDAQRYRKGGVSNFEDSEYYPDRHRLFDVGPPRRGQGGGSNFEDSEYYPDRRWRMPPPPPPPPMPPQPGQGGGSNFEDSEYYPDRRWRMPPPPPLIPPMPPQYEGTQTQPGQGGVSNFEDYPNRRFLMYPLRPPLRPQPGQGRGFAEGGDVKSPGHEIAGTIGGIIGSLIGNYFGGPIGGMAGKKVGTFAGHGLDDLFEGNSVGKDAEQDFAFNSGDVMSGVMGGISAFGRTGGYFRGA